MGTLRIRIELNKGRVGMPLGKLTHVCHETTCFLAMLCSDLGLPAPKESWLAQEFENASVDFDLCYPEALTDDLAELGRRALRMVFGEAHDDTALALRIGSETRRQYRRIGAALDIDEVAHFGVYRDGEARPQHWFELVHTSEVKNADGLIDRNTYGEVQGVVNAFFKEHKPPYLRIRELATNELVRCYFQPDKYQAAVELLEDRDAVVFIEGWLKEDAVSGQTREIRVEDFRPAPDFDLALYERTLGSIPDYTGSMSSEDVVKEARGDR